MRRLPAKILICGGRTFTHRPWMEQVIAALAKEFECIVIVHGDANGADRLAGEVGKRTAGVQWVWPCPAPWGLEGKAAGHLRNGWMLALAQPQLVVAFPGGPGTNNMVKQARASKVAVRDYRKAEFRTAETEAF